MPADLTSDNWEKALVEKGFDTKHPAVWIMEGLTMYVPYKDLCKLLIRIEHISASGSALACDALSTGFRNHPLMRKRLKVLKADGVPFVTYIDYPREMMKACGYATASYYFMGDPQASYGRYDTCPFLKSMQFTIRVVLGLIGALGVGLLVLSLPWFLYVPILCLTTIFQEAVIMAGAVEWLSRQLKMFFWPSPYLMTARVGAGKSHHA